jgi:dienelactone hydrolase
MLSSLLLCLAPAAAKEPTDRPPTGKALGQLVERYLGGDWQERARIRRELDTQVGPLDPDTLPKLRAELLKLALKQGKKLGRSGTNHFFDKESKRGTYIVSGTPTRALFIGLHGGGEGAGSAASAAGAMGGGKGWGWIFPEVLEKTERGWTDSGTEEFVLELIQAAKRTWKIDPDRIYITGHSMGGFGSWTIGAHHADMFAGVAPYAGAPIPLYTDRSQKTIREIQPGILPAFFNLALHVYQSGDDKNVPPEPNDFAMAALKGLKAKWPDGFNFRYDRVEGRGHAAPKEGYRPSQKWLASHARNPRPRAFLWQPVLDWKRQQYWIHWDRLELEALLEFRVHDGNRISITPHSGSGDVEGMSVLLAPELLDLDKEVVVTADGEELFRGKPVHRLSTLLMTLPRLDDRLLFSARADL